MFTLGNLLELGNLPKSVQDEFGEYATYHLFGFDKRSYPNVKKMQIVEEGENRAAVSHAHQRGLITLLISTYVDGGDKVVHLLSPRPREKFFSLSLSDGAKRDLLTILVAEKIIHRHLITVYAKACKEQVETDNKYYRAQNLFESFAKCGLIPTKAQQKFMLNAGIAPVRILTLIEEKAKVKAQTGNTIVYSGPV